MSELVLAEKWMIAQIKAAQTAAKAANPSYVILHVYSSKVPRRDLQQPPAVGQPPHFPCIVVRELSPGVDVTGLEGTTIMAQPLYLVEVIGITSFLDIDPIQKTIHASIHQKRGAGAFANVLSCVRIKPFKKEEEESGITYKRLGAEYRLLVQSED